VFPLLLPPVLLGPAVLFDPPLVEDYQGLLWGAEGLPDDYGTKDPVTDE